MSPSTIQQTAIGVPRRTDKVFVAKLSDDTASETFYRPVGGGIEFGETSADAVVREFRIDCRGSRNAVELGRTIGLR